MSDTGSDGRLSLYREVSEERTMIKLTRRNWLWWIDHYILRHHFRLVCQFEAWRNFIPWKEAGRLVREDD